MRLGSGRSEALGIAPKAALLDRAAAASIRVPTGFVVPDGVDPAPLAGESMRARWAVRSAFGAEDRAGESLAGWFTTKLDVSPDEIPAAIADVRASAERRAGTVPVATCS